MVMLVGYTETSKIELSTLNDYRYPSIWEPS
jgi:hypothetical protein